MRDLINSLGIGVIESSEELNLYNNIYADYKIEGNSENIDPVEIFNSILQPKIASGKTDYFKRTVLAAEIVDELHNEWAFGHVKLQKLVFLCQNTLNMDLNTNFLRQAMGPYDPSMMRSIDSQLKKKKWFSYHQSSNQKYLPLENAGEHKIWFDRYFQAEKDKIKALIELFRKAKTDHVEIAATVYACWLKLKTINDIVDMDLLLSKFYEWSPEKQRFNENEVRQVIDWMIDKKIHPISNS
jgi:hypothetical protein